MVLLDTHLLLWAAAEPHKLSQRAIELIQNPDNGPIFSAASIWEVAIKTALKRPDFQISSSRFSPTIESSPAIRAASNGFREPLIQSNAVAADLRAIFFELGLQRTLFSCHLSSGRTHEFFVEKRK